MDATQPRHSARRPAVTTYGTFVRMADESVILRARNGDHWTADYVSIQQGSWGFSEEGFERLPRPTTYDENGKVVIQGDIVRIDFLGGNYKLPLVSAGFRAAKRLDDFFVYNHQSDGADPNRFRLRARALDADGNVKGEMRFRALEDEGGAAAFQATESIELFVGEDLDAEDGVRITIDGTTITLDNGSVRLKVDGGTVVVSTSDTASTEPVILGTTMLNALTGALAEVVAIGAGIPAGAAIPTPNSSSMITGISAGTYLSTHLKTE